MHFTSKRGHVMYECSSAEAANFTTRVLASVTMKPHVQLHCRQDKTKSTTRFGVLSSLSTEIEAWGNKDIYSSSCTALLRYYTERQNGVPHRQGQAKAVTKAPPYHAILSQLDSRSDQETSIQDSTLVCDMEVLTSRFSLFPTSSE